MRKCQAISRTVTARHHRDHQQLSATPPVTAARYIAHQQHTSRQSTVTCDNAVVRSHRSVSRQSRAVSRQSRQSAHSQATDPVIDLMNKMFEKVAGDAAAQQAKMERKIERREREAMEKACLQMEVAQLKKDMADMTFFIAGAVVQSIPGNTHTPMISSSHAHPQLTADSMTSSTAGAIHPTATTRDAHTFSLSAPDSLTLYNHTYPPATAPVGMRTANDYACPPP